MVKNKKNGFSLIEAIIVLIVMAVALVALTPTITKKITNRLEYGTSLTGNSHGRYEVYMKEIYSLQDMGFYEKNWGKVIYSYSSKFKSIKSI